MRPFLLERYFARHEFGARHLLSPSDCEPLSLAELLALADDEHRAAWESLSLGYTDSAGLPRLRRAIAAGYAHCDPDDLLVCAPQEGIFLALHALIGPGDEVVCLLPAYQSLHEVAAAAGGTAIGWPLHAGSGHWHLDFDGLRERLGPRSRLLVINFPHNPTGFVPSAEELDELLAVAREHELWIFSDEMYRGLEHDPGGRLPSLADVHPRTVVLSGLSKAHGLPGLRIGWLRVGDPAVRERVASLKDYTTICASAPSEVLATIALCRADSLVEHNRRIVLDNLARARSFFGDRTERFDWLEPRGGTVVFPRRREGDAGAMCRAAVESCGLMIVPDTLFDMDAGHFRVGLGRRDFPAALQAFQAFLDGPGGTTD